MATMFSHFEGKGIDIMKSSRFFTGALTALLAVGLFIGGVIPGWATTLTPSFADCLGETWDIRHGEIPFTKETALLCQYDSDLLPDDFMTSQHHTTSNREMDWPGYVAFVKWDNPTASSFDENPLGSAKDRPLKNSMLRTEMFWEHVDTPWAHDKHSSFRIMVEGRS